MLEIIIISVFLGKGDIQPQLDSALQDVNDKYLLLEETEKQAVRRALIEERSRFCAFVSMLRPVVVSFLVCFNWIRCYFIIALVKGMHIIRDEFPSLLLWRLNYSE